MFKVIWRSKQKGQHGIVMSEETTCVNMKKNMFSIDKV